jgi:hypothetical protein
MTKQQRPKCRYWFATWSSTEEERFKECASNGFPQSITST